MNAKIEITPVEPRRTLESLYRDLSETGPVLVEVYDETVILDVFRTDAGLRMSLDSMARDACTVVAVEPEAFFVDAVNNAGPPTGWSPWGFAI